MIENDDFRLFKPTYTDRKGMRRNARKWYIEFKDHVSAEHRWPLFTHERQSRKVAERILELVGRRRTGEPADDEGMRFVETLPPSLREKLVEADIIDRTETLRGGLLLPHLEGQLGEDGKIETPGYRQALEAKNRSPGHIRPTVSRVRRLIEACGFHTCADLMRPGVITEVSVYLGQQRAAGKLNGTSYNYFVRDLRGFCAWMVKDKRLASNPFANLEGVADVEVDQSQYRELRVDEMRRLCVAALAAPERFKMSGADREFLYRFGFETGMRPGQIRGLTRASFDLDGDPPTVTATAATNKRRKRHTQVLLPAMAQELKARLAHSMPSAPAIRMPNIHRMARMLRADLADARAAWIAEAPEGEERAKRHQSDFLAGVDHAGRVAVFYSLRHSHGTELGNAGAPEKAIADSMHHTAGTTTRRYLHTQSDALAETLRRLPNIKPTGREVQAMAATGTDSASAPRNNSGATKAATRRQKEAGTQSACPVACAPLAPAGTPSATSDTLSGLEAGAVNLDNIRRKRDSKWESHFGLLAELADAMDSKSLARKGVSVRLR